MNCENSPKKAKICYRTKANPLFFLFVAQKITQKSKTRYRTQETYCQRTKQKCGNLGSEQIEMKHSMRWAKSIAKIRPKKQKYVAEQKQSHDTFGLLPKKSGNATLRCPSSERSRRTFDALTIFL